MPVPSARPTNRQIKFESAINLTIDTGATGFTGTEDWDVILDTVTPFTITSIWVETDVGTVDVNLKHDATVVTLASNSATSTLAEIAASANNTVAAGRRLTIETSSPASSVAILRIQINITIGDF